MYSYYYLALEPLIYRFNQKAIFVYDESDERSLYLHDKAIKLVETKKLDLPDDIEISDFDATKYNEAKTKECPFFLFLNAEKIKDVIDVTSVSTPDYVNSPLISMGLANEKELIDIQFPENNYIMTHILNNSRNYNFSHEIISDYLDDYFIDYKIGSFINILRVFFQLSNAITSYDRLGLKLYGENTKVTNYKNENSVTYMIPGHRASIPIYLGKKKVDKFEEVEEYLTSSYERPNEVIGIPIEQKCTGKFPILLGVLLRINTEGDRLFLDSFLSNLRVFNNAVYNIYFRVEFLVDMLLH